MREQLNLVNRHDINTTLLQPMFRRFTLVKRLLSYVCVWLACSELAMAQEKQKFTDYDLKAVYLFRFTQFTDWPANAFTSTNAPIVIGIVGDDPFGKTLDDVVKGESVRGHPLVIKRLNSSDDLQSCQMLFICRNEKEQLPALLQKLKGNPILTMGDDDGFAESGGMVNLVLVDGKVKLEINPAAAEQAGLQISGKALRLAHIVKSN